MPPVYLLRCTSNPLLPQGSSAAPAIAHLKETGGPNPNHRGTNRGENDGNHGRCDLYRGKCSERRRDDSSRKQPPGETTAEPLPDLL